MRQGRILAVNLEDDGEDDEDEEEGGWMKSILGDLGELV